MNQREIYQTINLALKNERYNAARVEELHDIACKYADKFAKTSKTFNRQKFLRKCGF